MTRYFRENFLSLVLAACTVAAPAYASESSVAIIEASKLQLQCHENGWNKEALLKLKNDEFKIEDKTVKRNIANQLLSCLASPEHAIRDEVAYTGLSKWLRANEFSNGVYLSMFTTLTKALAPNVRDESGVYQPFAALMLSEVIRVDRVHPYLNDEQRELAVSVAASYLKAINDYRGFDDKTGWRHAVAHTADLMLQLALNPAITKVQLESLLAALSTQVSADNKHYYVHGEPKRMAMAVAYNFLTGKHTEEEWTQWLAKVTEPAPLRAWQDAYKSETGLAKLHNTQSFLNSFYALIKTSKNATLVMMVPALEKAIQTVK